MKNLNDNNEILFKQGCDEWLVFKQKSAKESTYLNYRFSVNKHIKPDLGDKTLLELSNYDMNEYIIKKEKNLILIFLMELIRM